MACNPSRETLSVMAACPRLPFPMEAGAEERESRQRRPSAFADVLSLGANQLAIDLAGLFGKFGWTVRRAANLAEAREYLGHDRAAVVVCEEALPDAAWQDAALALSAIPGAPMFVAIGGDKARLDEVLGLGGFDLLTRPLRDAEVIWTVASAWHQWMKRFEHPDEGDARCSDA